MATPKPVFSMRWWRSIRVSITCSSMGASIRSRCAIWCTARCSRGPKDLLNTAIFVGGSDVAVGEQILQEVKACFFGPMRVSVLFDANGANTTAGAAILVAQRHVDLSRATATVLAATGPVGQRAVRLLSRAGARVRVASRRLARAEAVCDEIRESVADAHVTPCATSTPEETAAAMAGSEILIAAGAAGFELVSQPVWQSLQGLRVAIDLNAVPPAGIAGVDPLDAGRARDDVICYGAIGVGGLKMKIHKGAIRALFEANDRMCDAEEVFEIGRQLEAASG